MSLTIAQLTTLKAAITAETDPAFVAARVANNEQAMADWYNMPSGSYVWRTAVSRSEIYNRTSEQGTTWSWTFYKNQSVVEQNAWVQMFMGDEADFAQDNLRAGIGVIFTSASAANATHALNIGKRQSARAEKLFATGAGTLATPAKMGWEGLITAQHISDALRQ